MTVHYLDIKTDWHRLSSVIEIKIMVDINIKRSDLP